MNPYMGNTFIGFFVTLFKRLLFLQEGALASDEVQLLVLIGIALSSVLVGTFLILRKMTLLANALSHTVLLGIVIAFLCFKSEGLLPLPVLMGASLIMGLVTAMSTQGLQKLTRLSEDASIGLIFSLFFALGVLLISLISRNAHLGLELIMGNADALIKGDIRLVWSIFGVNALLFTLYYRGYKITTFDPQMAKALGFAPLFYSYMLMFQTSLTTVGAFRCIGVFMVLALLVVPPLLVRLFVNSLIPLVLYAALLSVVVVLIGVALSRHILSCYGVGVSTGGIIVTLLFLLFMVAAFCKQVLYSPRRA